MLKPNNLARHSQSQPTRVYGVDFSGAANAGKKIWVATGNITGDVLEIEDCHRAQVLQGSGRYRDQCLVALRHFIGAQQVCACGLDFPFGLPYALVDEDSWEEFVVSFGDHYPSPEEFRKACREAACDRELKRVTDQDSKTPYSPYNLRLYRQTYFGIRDVLAPLVRDQMACVLPMQRALSGKPWIFEICPASTLKQEGLYLRYKGRSKENSTARACILEGIERTGALLIQASVLRSRILNDQDGDALDSIVAAFATARALRNPASLSVLRTSAYALEGYVYV